MKLVTGAAGLSGSMIVREFSRRGSPLRALVRDLSSATKIGSLPHVEIVEGDMLEPSSLHRALDGVERVLMISSSNARMIETQCAFIDACVEAGVPHLIKFSGAEAGIGYDQNMFRFTRMHAFVEKHLELSGLGWTHLRPAQFMQVFLREARNVASLGELRLPFENIELSPVAVEDIAHVAYALLERGGFEGESFEMTGPEALTGPDFAERIGSAIGKPVKYVPIAPQEWLQTAAQLGVASFNVAGLAEQTRERRRHSKSHVSLDTHERFGVVPTTFARFASAYASVFEGKPVPA